MPARPHASTSGTPCIRPTPGQRCVSNNSDVGRTIHTIVLVALGRATSKHSSNGTNNKRSMMIYTQTQCNPSRLPQLVASLSFSSFALLDSLCRMIAAIRMIAAMIASQWSDKFGLSSSVCRASQISSLWWRFSSQAHSLQNPFCSWHCVPSFLSEMPCVRKKHGGFSLDVGGSDGNQPKHTLLHCQYSRRHLTRYDLQPSYPTKTREHYLIRTSMLESLRSDHVKV